MAARLEELIARWNGLAVISRFHAATASWIFVALHDNALGSPTGGTRMQRYATPEEGLRDALRLAEGMTHKWAAIELDFGGGKAVLALSRQPSQAERGRLLAAYGRLLAALRGAFSTGQDLGTTADDMRLLRRHTPHVHGPDAQGRVLEPGPYTARGVLAGIRAAVRHVSGSSELAGRRILVQGLGGVGEPLARSCAEAGAKLLLNDRHAARAGRLAGELRGEVVPEEAVYGVACNVYAPCAVGSTLSRRTIPRLDCRIVAGAANNQLAEPDDAERLARRGILYAPDFVINGGGALAFGLRARGVTDEDVIAGRLDGLEGVLAEIFAEAARRGESPLLEARRRVDRLLARARRQRGLSPPGGPTPGSPTARTDG